MRLITKLLVLGSAVAGTGYLAYRRRKHHAGPIGEKPSADQDFGMIPDADIIEEIVIVGIAEVDPEANPAAHEGVRDPRDRLPRSR